MRTGLLLGVIGLCVAVMSAAHGQAPLKVIAEAGASDWKHEKSGVVLPGSVLGLERGPVQDATGGGESDVFARYENNGGRGVITLYLYRPAVANVPLWFDRADIALRKYQGIGRANPATTFAPPGSATASAMQVSYAMPGGAAFTALALVPVGDWVLKIRLTGPGTAADAEAKIGQIVGAVRLPEGPDSPAASAVLPCATQPAYQKAKARKPDGASVVLVAVMELAVEEGASADVWCRGEEQEEPWGLYRKANATDDYVMALMDSGRVLRVKPVPLLKESKKPDYALFFIDPDRIHQFPQLSALPSPEQAVTFLRTLRPVAEISRDSKNINLMLGDIQFE